MSRVQVENGTPQYSLGSWKTLSEEEVPRFLEQQVITTDRLTVVRCVYRPGYEVAAHWHPQEQITIVEEGTLSLVVDGKAVEIRAGEMISIPPRVRHATQVSGADPVRALNLFLRPDAALGSAGGPSGPRMYR